MVAALSGGRRGKPAFPGGRGERMNAVVNAEARPGEERRSFSGGVSFGWAQVSHSAVTDGTHRVLRARLRAGAARQRQQVLPEPLGCASPEGQGRVLAATRYV